MGALLGRAVEKGFSKAWYLIRPDQDLSDEGKSCKCGESGLPALSVKALRQEQAWTLKGSYAVFQEKSKEESKVGSKIGGRGPNPVGLVRHD